MDLSPRAIAFALRAPVKGDVAATTAERLYVIADLMEATDRAITHAWEGLGAREEAVQAALTDYDFLMRAKGLRKLAEAWQEQLDAEIAE